MATLRSIAVMFALLLVGTLSSSAQLAQMYISNEGQKELQLLNPNTSELTTLYNLAAEPDDLTLNSLGQLIYSVPAAGTVNLFDPVAKTNTTLVSGLKWVRDLEVEPGGQTLLIAVYSPGEIVRYNFATGKTTTLIKKLGTCDGITYDPNGNLYAVANHNTIIQINPVTGAILSTLTLETHHGVNGGDGLTYDSYSGALWATHDGTTGTGVIKIPISQTGLTGDFTLYLSKDFGTSPDGIKSDGNGNLYIGAIWWAMVYNIPTNTITYSIVTKGADGVALVPGTY
jgi:sugar lactone lactonase YvrE